MIGSRTSLLSLLMAFSAPVTSVVVVGMGVSSSLVGLERLLIRAERKPVPLDVVICSASGGVQGSGVCGGG